MSHVAHITEMLPSIKPRTLTLGQTLVLELFEVPRGLSAVYDRIHAVVGSMYGTRNTFAKLLHAESFASLNEKDRFRAWLLMSALGMDPRDGGGADTSVPAQFNVAELRRALELPELDSNQQPAGYTHSAPESASNLIPLPRNTRPVRIHEQPARVTPISA